MSRPVFISYARDASRAHAAALHAALGGEAGGLSFLDSESLGVGDPVPARLLDALLEARVVVVFAEPVYFTRRYCLQEFHFACAPFLRVADAPGATPAAKEAALRGIVLALPPRGVDPMLERFPPTVRARNWPGVDQPEALEALVRAELAAAPPTLRERYGGEGDAERARFLSATQLPPPQRIGRIPFAPAVGLPTSIGDAFVGRVDDIWRVHHLLTSRRGGLRSEAGVTTSIEAGGGFGKTRLALEYLYRFGTRHFRGGLFWIDAEQEPEDRLYEVLRALSPAAPPVEAVRAAPGGVPGAVARAVRALPDDAPPLFVVDNVPEPRQGEPPQPLETWCPVPGEVAVLTTSRTRLALGSGAVEALRIQALEPGPAVDLLANGDFAGRLARAEWGEVAEWVGRLPLALELLNRAMLAGAVQPRDALEASRRGGSTTRALDDAMAALRGSVPPGALRGIGEAFSLSYDLLSTDQRFAARLLAWMAPAPVPEAVLDVVGPDVFSPETRAVLRARSFVTPVSGGEDGAFFGAVHRVLADFLRSQSPAPDEEVKLVASALTLAVGSVQNAGDRGARRVRACAPASVAALEHFAAPGASAVRTAAALDFADFMGPELWAWAMPETAGVVYRLAWQLNAAAKGAEHPDAFYAMGMLAETLRARGDYAGAQALHEQGLEARSRALGDEHPDTLDSMNNLAVTLLLRGDHARAQALQERVLEARRRALGDEHPLTLTALHNLAQTLRARGDLAAALEMLERVTEAMRRTAGEEEGDTLVAMNNLALLRRERGDFGGAQALQERVLEARRRAVGEAHPETLSAMHNLALTLHERGEHADAQALMERVLEGMRHARGEEHPDTLTVMHNQAVWLREAKDDAGARPLYERVLEARRRILGEEHPDTLMAMSNLANSLGALGDRTGARALHERVLEARRRVLGDEHPDTLASMNNVANALSSQGDHAGSGALHQRVLEAKLRVLGAEHPDTSMSAWNLALAYERLGRDPAPVIDAHLRWLLARDPDSLATVQRTIRGYVEARARLPGAQPRKPWWRFW
ncbi:MAG TPA: tetratricopeptide repeat protein [Longimicrobiaceae bacterium]|nr:tetratricopeptide repeat protein [Longimicrobiaceae bacterium]